MIIPFAVINLYGRISGNAAKYRNLGGLQIDVMQLITVDIKQVNPE